MEHEPTKGKFNSKRDEILYLLSLDGWANESTGDVSAPGGYVAKISNTAEELPEVLEAFEEEVGRTGFTDTAKLIGHFLLQEDEQGFVTVREYDSQLKLDDAFSTASLQYTAWLNEAEGEA